MGTLAPRQHYARELRAARAGRDWTQSELAKRSGLGLNTIKRFENAEREPRIGQLIALAHVLGVPAREFLPDTEQGANDAAES